MNYTIKPEEHELREARQVVEQTLESIKAVLEKDRDFVAETGWFPRDRMIDGEVPVGYGWTEALYLPFNTGMDGWENKLRAETAKAYSQACFHEKLGVESYLRWQLLLRDAYGTLHASKALDFEPYWESIDEEKVRGSWEEIRESIREDSGVIPEVLEDVWMPLAYRIGQELLEEHGLEEFPGLKRGDVVEAGDELFG